MQSIFPTQQQRNQQPPLVEIKAGRCALVSQPSGKFLVTPERTLGKITLTAENGTLSLKWVTRPANVQQDSRIVLPNQASLKKVNTGVPTDRVYALKFTDGGRPLVYWMQDKDASKDEELIEKINGYIANPSSIPQRASPPDLMDLLGGRGRQPGAPSTQPIAGGLDLSSLLNNLGSSPVPHSGQLTGEDLRRAMASAGLSPAPVPAPAPTPVSTSAPAPSITTNTNTAIPTPTSLTTPSPAPAPTSSLPPPSTPSQPSAAASSILPMNLDFSQLGLSPLPATPTPSAPLPSHPRSLPLQDLLSPEAILNSGALSDPQVRSRLLETLPPSQRQDQDIEDSIRSPQFRQALASLSLALNDPQPQSYSAVLGNLGLDPSQAMDRYLRGDAIGGFLAAVQAQARAQTSQTQTQPPQGEEGANNSEGDSKNMEE